MMSSNKTRILLIALGLVVCCLVGLPNLYDKYMTARFVAAATGLAIIFLLAIVSRKRWTLPHTPVFYVYLLYIFLSGCSILWATNTAEAVFAFACQLLTPLIIIVFYNLLSTDRLLLQKTLWTSAAVILAVYLLFAVVQLFHVESFCFEQLYRVSGINGHKNLLAAMLFVLSAFLLTSFSIFENRLPKWISVALFVAAISVIILLKSRAVLLSLLVAGGFFGVMMWIGRFVPRNDAKQGHSAKRVGVTLVVSIVLVYAFLTVGLRWFADHSVPLSSVKSEVETKMTSTSSLVERCLLWDKTYHIVDQQPIVGCGIGNWQILFPDAGLKGLYRSDVWNVNFTKPHNEYLGILSETGYLGLLLYLVFLVSLVVRAVFALRKTQSRNDYFYGTLVLSVFLGSCVNALFDFPNSRIEHILWTGILMAFLLQIITQDMKKTLMRGWNYMLLIVAVLIVLVGLFRLKGERNTFMMQQALRANDWKSVERYCQQAQSVFYTLDPVGLPIHWYQGKAEKALGKPQSLNSFRKARHYAPYCKENLNDLGLAEYYTAHNLDKAEYYLQEAIRISPNYLYPYLNLAYIYLTENEPQKAQEVADQLYYDEHKCEVMKADAVFFEPFNTEAVRRKIDADYQATLLLRKTILNKMQNVNPGESEEIIY